MRQLQYFLRSRMYCDAISADIIMFAKSNFLSRHIKGEQFKSWQLIYSCALSDKILLGGMRFPNWRVLMYLLGLWWACNGESRARKEKITRTASCVLSAD